MIGVAVIIYVGFSAVVAQVARSYDRSPVVWFILSLLFSPVTSFIFLIVADVPHNAVAAKYQEDCLRKQYPEEKDLGQVALGETRCPQCGATVNTTTQDGLHSPEDEPWLLLCKRCQTAIEPPI